MNEKLTILGDRMYGLLTTAFFGGLATAVMTNTHIDNIEKIIGGCVGIVGTTEGLGDLIRGKHHYLSSKVKNFFYERRNIKYLL